jgi:4-amino-4-deoxy-L-arabinose transferase-like glycosyltransferase
VALLFARLGERGLLESSEARYAETAREMSVSGDWVTPRYFGVKHFHKPPLTYWLTCVGYGLFGANEFGARFFLVVAGLATLWLVWWMGRLWYGPLAGQLAAGILLTAPLFCTFTRVLTTDLYLALSSTAAIAAFLAGHGGRRGFYLWMWFAAGAGFLLKGPVVLLLVASAVLPFLWFEGRPGQWREVCSGAGLALFAVVALPWFVAVCWMNPGLFSRFVWYETLERVATTVHGRTGSPAFFVGVFLAGFFPWSLLAPAAVAARWPLVRQGGPNGGADRLLACWFAIPFVLFSLSKSKLMAYILPIFPPAAILLAAWLAAALEGDWRWPRTSCLGALVGAAGSVAVLGLALGPAASGATEGLRTHLLLTLPVLLLWALSAHSAGRRKSVRPLLAGTCAVALLYPALVAPFGDRLEGEYGSLAPLARALRREARPDEPVLLCRHGATSLPFYLERPVRTFQCDVDLRFEEDRTAAERWHLSRMEQVVKLLGAGPAWVVGDRDTLREVDRAQQAVTGRSLRFLAQAGKLVLAGAGGR